MYSGNYTSKGAAGLLNDGGKARHEEAEKAAASMVSTVIKGVNLPLKTPEAPTCSENLIAISSDGRLIIIMKSISP